MLFKTQHIVFKICTIILLCVVLLPSIVKLNHAFENHKHEICKGEAQAHFHEINVDCEFYKFNLNSAFEFTKNTIVFLNIEENYQNIISQYAFISSYQKRGFSLRGPPQLV